MLFQDVSCLNRILLLSVLCMCLRMGLCVCVCCVMAAEVGLKFAQPAAPAVEKHSGKHVCLPQRFGWVHSPKNLFWNICCRMMTNCGNSVPCLRLLDVENLSPSSVLLFWTFFFFGNSTQALFFLKCCFLCISLRSYYSCYIWSFGLFYWMINQSHSLILYLQYISLYLICVHADEWILRHTFWSHLHRLDGCWDKCCPENNELYSCFYSA